MERFVIDILGPLLETPRKNKSILIVSEYMSLNGLRVTQYPTRMPPLLSAIGCGVPYSEEPKGQAQGRSLRQIKAQYLGSVMYVNAMPVLGMTGN